MSGLMRAVIETVTGAWSGWERAGGSPCDELVHMSVPAARHVLPLVDLSIRACSLADGC